MLFVSSDALVGCASVEIPDIHPHITQPGSHDGFWVSTLTDAEGIIPAPQWTQKLLSEPHVILFSPDWAKLRFTILKNCLTMECKNAVGTLDSLFEAIDTGLKKRKSILGK